MTYTRSPMTSMCSVVPKMAIKITKSLVSQSQLEHSDVIEISSSAQPQYRDKRHSTFTGECGVVWGFGELFLKIFAWLRSGRWH